MIVDLPPTLYGAAVSLWEEVGLTRPWNDPGADLTRAVESPASTVLAAVVDGQLLGTAMVGVDGHRGWLYYLAVSPPAQGNGLGRLLVSTAEQWVHDRGHGKLMLMVRSTNTAVLGFYAALGYEVNEVATLGKRL